VGSRVNARAAVACMLKLIRCVRNKLAESSDYVSDAMDVGVVFYGDRK